MFALRSIGICVPSSQRLSTLSGEPYDIPSLPRVCLYSEVLWVRELYSRAVGTSRYGLFSGKNPEVCSSLSTVFSQCGFLQQLWAYSSKNKA